MKTPPYIPVGQKLHRLKIAGAYLTVMTAPIRITRRLTDCWAPRATFSLPVSSAHRILPSSLVTVIFFLADPLLDVVDLPKLL